jgi:uncharacterized protein YyaL (SSP411 family)
MLSALENYHGVPLQVILVVSSDGSEKEREDMRSLVRSTFLPGAVVLVARDEDMPEITKTLSIVEGKRASRGTTAYVCERGSCELPARDAATLKTQLRERLPSVFR